MMFHMCYLFMQRKVLCFLYREWYSYHFPELVKIVNDNSTYCKVARLIKNRKEFTEDKVAELEELVMDDAKVKAILDASKSSMGKYHQHSCSIQSQGTQIQLDLMSWQVFFDE